jgi:hypothetical protein
VDGTTLTELNALQAGISVFGRKGGQATEIQAAKLAALDSGGLYIDATTPTAGNGLRGQIMSLSTFPTKPRTFDMVAHLTAKEMANFGSSPGAGMIMCNRQVRSATPCDSATVAM